MCRTMVVERWREAGLEVNEARGLGKEWVRRKELEQFQVGSLKRRDGWTVLV